MPRCFRLCALVLAAALGVAGGRAQTASPLGSAALGLASVSVAPDASGVTFALGVPYPNPFTEAATVTYTIGEPGPVRLELFDALGRRVSVIEDEARPAGEYRVRLNGNALLPGLYVLRLTAGDHVATRRLVRGY